MRIVICTSHIRVAMMLWTSMLAYLDARNGEVVWASILILCTLFWMFRIIGGLRAESHS